MNNKIEYPKIVETENGVIDCEYYCAREQKVISMNKCEHLCSRYYSCDNIAIMNDWLAENGY